jgi:hypothetical protein
MAERKNTHGLSVRTLRGVAVVDIGDMEIWDGADLSLVRDTLSVLIDRRHRRSVGIDMRHVKYVPSGFFGMLYDWFEAGISVYLFEPQQRVINMLWFQRFFAPDRAGLWRLEDVHEVGIDAGISAEEAQASEAWATSAAAPRSAPFLTMTGG